MTRTFKVLIALAVAAGLLIIAGSNTVRSAGDSLENHFINPPDEAKPRVWWHWTGGNVTKEGITKDLEWMKRIGISGGQVIENKIEFFTPEWFDAVRHAAAESDRLGLELSIFSSSGWSLTGGPWVKPEQAMKKLVWSETNVEGPMRLTQKLPQPPSNFGAFGSLRGLSGSRSTSSDTFYKDSAVIAFRTPPDETLMEDLAPIVTTSGGKIDPSLLMDDIIATSATIVAGKDGIA